MHLGVMWKVRRTIFPHDAKVYSPSTPSSFLTWLKSAFRDGRRLAHLLGQVVRLLRHHGARRAGERAPCLEIIQRSGLPGPPAGGRGKDGRIQNGSSRYSPAAHEKWRHFACTYVAINFCTSPFCVDVNATARVVSERRAASGGRRPAGGGRPTEADAGIKPATQVATARRNRARCGGLCVIARGTKEQKPPFLFFFCQCAVGPF